MNCKSLLIFFAALTGLLGHSRLFAAATVQEIQWAQYAKSVDEVAMTGNSKDTTFVYLYNTTKKKFLTSGGTYGVQAIMADMGMRLAIVKVTSGENTYYKIITRVANDNHGSALSFRNDAKEVYLDRKETLITDTQNGYYSLPFWIFSGDKTAYDIKNSYYQSAHLYYDSTDGYVKATTDNTPNYDWIIVTADDYYRLTSQLEATYVNISSLIHDGRFGRCDKDITKWTKRNADVFQNWASLNDVQETLPYGAYGTATIKGKGSIKQTVTNLTPGLYRVACQAFLVADANDCTYLVANEQKVLVKTITQSEFEKSTREVLTKEKSLKAGYIFADGNRYNNGENNTAYTNEVYVMVKADEGKKTGTLTLGIENTCNAGVAYADNFQLYFCDATKELYIDANNASTENFTVAGDGTPSGLDRRAYNYPVRLNLRRAFTLNAWNAIVLPLSLSADQVKQAFGTAENPAKLSKLQGISPNRASLINFQSVNLNAEDSEGLIAGECYVVYVTKSPDVTDKNTQYSYTNKQGNVTEPVTVNGPIYQIGGVTQDAYTGETVTKDYTTTNGTLAFTGYYTKPTSVEAKMYIVKNGNMYHLTSEYIGGVYATCWTLADVAQSAAKTLTFAIDDEEMGTVTAIEGIVNGDAEPVSPAEAVYNLNGQRVGTAAQFDTLPAGVYVIKGKKVMVR